MSSKMNNAEVQDALATLNETTEVKWQIKNEKLVKTFEFKSFVHAFGWMTQIAIWAENLNHHPEWFNVYNRVEVELTTHDADGITALDFELAGKMELFC